MDRTTWLDGLRGLAAAIVAFNHYFMGGVLDYAFRSFWAEPAEDNHHLIQLPPIRLVFAAHAMVPLFFVISGYAISINLIKARDTDTTSNGNDFLRRLSSTATRRIFRIYLPVFVIATISQILFFCNLYTWDFGDEVLWGRRPWTAPWFHLSYLMRYILDLTNCIQFHQNPGLNGQLWTMPFEFRGSCIVYLTILSLAFWKPRTRRWVLVAMMGYFFYYGLWDIFAFMAGLYLAEGAVHSAEKVFELMELPYIRSTTILKRTKSIPFSRIGTIFCFVAGIYLICLSDDGYLPPGYQFLSHLESSRWDNDWAVSSKCWKAVGSVLLVYAISQLTLLQRLLDSPVVQYLGKISFSLYLIHQSVYHVARNPVLDAFWYVLKGQSYPGTEEARKSALAFVTAWIGGFLVMGMVVVWLADLYTKYVDVRCIRFARKVEGWLT